MIDYEVSVLDKRNHMRHKDLFHAGSLFDLIYSVHSYYAEQLNCLDDNIIILQITAIL